jgi:hypothetical protein
VPKPSDDKQEPTAEELAKLRGDVVEEEAEEEEDLPGDVAPEEEEEEEEPEAISIPKARFDEVQRKAREREQVQQRRIEQLEAAQVKASVDIAVDEEAEIETLTTKYEDLLLEGEIDKARAVRKQRDAKQKEFLQKELTKTSQQTGNAAVEQMRFDAQLAQFEVLHPEINPDSKEFDEAAVAEVNELLQAFRTSGMALPAALGKAIKYVFKEGPAADTGKADEVRSKRSETERKRVAGAAKKMPPSLAGKGRDSDKLGARDGLPDITRMTPEQFDKLTPEQLSTLRGDRLSSEEAA